MRIAIVGAAGQVGAAIMRRLAQRADLSVFGITRNEFSAEPLRHQGFEVRVGSVCDPINCGQLLASSDLIVNAALHIGLPKFARSQNESIVRSLIEQSRGSIVVHLSTVAVYGSCHDKSFSTFENPRGDSTYACEKLRLERYASSVAERSGCRLAILRLGHVYGPGQGFSKGVFADLESLHYCLPFDGSLSSNAIHVNRLADSIPTLFSSLDGITIFNAVNAPQTTWRAVYDLHSTAAGLPLAGQMSESTSAAQRAAYRAQAQRTTSGRLGEAILHWLRNLPLKALADAHGVREAMDVAMLKLPGHFEDMVYTRYQRFAAKQRISVGSASSAPPWYFSDPVPGPNLLKELSIEVREELRLAEANALSVWYSSFSTPEWKLPVDQEN